MNAHIRRLVRRLRLAQERRDLIGIMGLEAQLRAALA
jgi:hypothetical protein